MHFSFKKSNRTFLKAAAKGRSRRFRPASRLIFLWQSCLCLVAIVLLHDAQTDKTPKKCSSPFESGKYTNAIFFYSEKIFRWTLNGLFWWPFFMAFRIFSTLHENKKKKPSTFCSYVSMYFVYTIQYIIATDHGWCQVELGLAIIMT